MKKFIKYLPLIVLLFVACQNDKEEYFTNKCFIDAKSMINETIIKGTIGDVAKTLNLSLARPAEYKVNAEFVVDPSIVNTYNKSYYANAVILPNKCYEVVKGKVTVGVNSVKSTDAIFKFKNLSSLNRDLIYVLPITVKTDDIALLASSKHYYYVFRAGALINVVADINKNYLTVNWKTASDLEQMQNVTLEALIKVRDFSRLITTVMGIEGQFLFRIGDADRKGNQIQIATNSGNFPAPDASKGLPINKWIHVAMTYDKQSQEMIIYVDGKEQSKVNAGIINVNLNGFGDRAFFIGKSYDNGRYLDGWISEVRVWKVIRTKEEISSHIYSVDPKTDGLVAYWKFDEPSGNIVKDVTGNGNDAIANSNLSWLNVSLPEK